MLPKIAASVASGAYEVPLLSANASSRPALRLADTDDSLLHAADQTPGIFSSFAIRRETENRTANGGGFRPDGALWDRFPDQIAKLRLQLAQIFGVFKGFGAIHSRDDTQHTDRM